MPIRWRRAQPAPTPPCYGTPERDDITGTASGETIYTIEDNDRVYGGVGNDSIDASFNDTPGSTDRIYGGRGNDFIVSAFDGNVDVISCGKGTDEVAYDQALDTVKSCETKHPQ